MYSWALGRKARFSRLTIPAAGMNPYGYRRERETQLWRHLWVAHIGTTLLDEDSFGKVVDQLDEVSFGTITRLFRR